MSGSEDRAVVVLWRQPDGSLKIDAEAKELLQKLIREQRAEWLASVRAPWTVAGGVLLALAVWAFAQLPERAASTAADQAATETFDRVVSQQDVLYRTIKAQAVDALEKADQALATAESATEKANASATEARDAAASAQETSQNAEAAYKEQVKRYKELVASLSEQGIKVEDVAKALAPAVQKDLLGVERDVDRLNQVLQWSFQLRGATDLIYDAGNYKRDGIIWSHLRVPKTLDAYNRIARKNRLEAREIAQALEKQPDLPKWMRADVELVLSHTSGL